MPGSIISSIGLNKYLPIVTVGSSPAAANFSARSPTNCIWFAFFFCSSYICTPKILSLTNSLAANGSTPAANKFLYSSLLVWFQEGWDFL